MLLLVLQVSSANVRISVCEGGACTRGGGKVLLDAAQCLSHGLAEVLPAPCCSICPSPNGCVVQQLEPRGETKVYRGVLIRSDATKAIEQVKEMLTNAGAPMPSTVLESAFANKYEAEQLISVGGKAKEAVLKFDAALEIASKTVLCKGPAQEPIQGEEMVWEESRWVLTTAAMGTSELVFADSITTFDFGEGEAGTFSDCESSPDFTTLTGFYEESSDTSGPFRIVMSADGRTFEGEYFIDQDEAAKQFLSGYREPSGPSAEVPPPGMKWAFECLVGRSLAKKELGDMEGALQDARAAVNFMPRVPQGWDALADLLTGVEGEEQEFARRQAAWLVGKMLL